MTTLPRFETHEVLNQSPPFVDVDLYALDRPLQDAVVANGGQDDGGHDVGARVADLRPARRHGDVGGGQGVATEDEGPFAEGGAHALGADPPRRCRAADDAVTDDAAAAEAQ